MISSLELLINSAITSNSSVSWSMSNYSDGKYDSQNNEEVIDPHDRFKEGWIDITTVNWNIYAKTFIRYHFETQNFSNELLAALLKPILQFHIEFGLVVLKQCNKINSEEGIALLVTLLETINDGTILQHIASLDKYVMPASITNITLYFFRWLSAAARYCHVARQRKLIANFPARFLLIVCKMMKTNPENYAELKSSQIVPLVIENLNQFCLPKEYVVSTITLHL